MAIVSAGAGTLDPEQGRHFFWDIDDQMHLLQFTLQMRFLPFQPLDALALGARRVWLGATLPRGQKLVICAGELLAPALEHRGVDALLLQQRTELVRFFAGIGRAHDAPLLAGGATLNTLLGLGQVAAQLHLTFGLLVLSMFEACAIGLLGGLFPALDAARRGIAAAPRDRE